MQQQQQEGNTTASVGQTTTSPVVSTTAAVASVSEVSAIANITNEAYQVTSVQLRRPHTSHVRITNANPLLLPPSQKPLSTSSALAQLKSDRGGYWQFAAGGLAFHPTNTAIRADSTKQALLDELATRSVAISMQRRRKEEDDFLTLNSRGRSMSPQPHASLVEQQSLIDAGSTPNSGFHVGLPQAYPARVQTSAGLRMTDRRDFTQTDADQVSRRSAKGMHFMMNNNAAAAQGFKEERVKGLPKEAGAAPTVTHLLNSVFHSSLLPPHSLDYHLHSADPTPPVEPKRERTVQELIADDDRMRREENIRQLDMEAHGRLTANGGRLPHASSLARSDSSRTRPSRQHKRTERKPFADMQYHSHQEMQNHSAAASTKIRSDVDWSNRSRRIQAFLETDYTLPLLTHPKSAPLSHNQFNPALEPFRYTHTVDSQRAKNQFQYAAPTTTVNISPSIAINAIPHPRGFDPAVTALPKAFHDSNARVLQQGMDSDRLRHIQLSQQEYKEMLVPDVMKPMLNTEQLLKLEATSDTPSSDKLSGRLSLLDEYLKTDVTAIVDAHKPQTNQALLRAATTSTALVASDTAVAQWPPPFHSPFVPPQLDHAYFDHLLEKQSSQSARVHRPKQQQSPVDHSVFRMSWEEEKAEPVQSKETEPRHSKNHINPLQPPTKLVPETIAHSHVHSHDEPAGTHCSHMHYTHRSASPQPSLDPLASADMGSSLWSYLSGPFEKNLFKQRGRSRGIYSSQSSRRKKIEGGATTADDEQKEPYSAAQQAADRLLQSQRNGARSPTRICKTSRAIDAAAIVQTDYQHRIARSRLGSRAGVRTAMTADFQTSANASTEFGEMRVVVDDVSELQSSEPTFDADGNMTVVVPSVDMDDEAAAAAAAAAAATAAAAAATAAAAASEVDPDAAEVDPDDAKIDVDVIATDATYSAVHVIENHHVSADSSSKHHRLGTDILSIPLTTLSANLSVEGSLVVPGMKLSVRSRSVSPGASLRSSSNSSPAHSPTRSQSKARTSSNASPSNLHMRHNSTSISSRSGASSRAGHTRSASHAVMGNDYSRARSAGATRGGSKGDLASMLRNELAMSGFEYISREQQDESISQWVTDAMNDAESNEGPTHSIDESAVTAQDTAVVEEDPAVISAALAAALEAERIEFEAAKRAEAADLALHSFVSPSMHALSPKYRLRAVKKQAKTIAPVPLPVLPITAPPAVVEINNGPKKWSKRRPKTRPVDDNSGALDGSTTAIPLTTEPVENNVLEPVASISKVETELSGSVSVELISPQETDSSLFTPQSSAEPTSNVTLEFPLAFPAEAAVGAQQAPPATAVSSSSQHTSLSTTPAMSRPDTARAEPDSSSNNNEPPPRSPVTTSRSRPTTSKVASTDKNVSAKSAASSRSTSPASSGRSGAAQQTRSKPSSRSISRRGSLSTAQAIAMAQRVLMDEVGAALTKRMSMGKNTKIDINAPQSKRKSLVDFSPVDDAKTPLTRPPSHHTSRRPSLAAAGAAVALAAGIAPSSTSIPPSRNASRRQSRRSSLTQDSDLSAVQAQLQSQASPTATAVEKAEAAITAGNSNELPHAHLRTSSVPLPVRQPLVATAQPSSKADDTFDADELLSPSMDSSPAPSPFMRANSLAQSPSFRPLDGTGTSPSSRRSTISKLDDKELEEIRQRRAVAKEKRLLKRMSQVGAESASPAADAEAPLEAPTSPLQLSGMSHEDALAAGLIAGTIQAELAALHSDPSEISDSAESSTSAKTSPLLRPTHRRTPSSQRRSVTAAAGASPGGANGSGKKKRKSRRTLSHQDAMQFVVSDDEETEIKEEEKDSSDEEVASPRSVTNAETNNNEKVAETPIAAPAEASATTTATTEPSSSAGIALVSILKTKMGKAARKSIASGSSSGSPSSNPTSPRNAARASFRKSVVFGEVDVAPSPKTLKERQLSTASDNKSSSRSPVLLRRKTMDPVAASSRSPVAIRRASSITSVRTGKIKAKAFKGKSDKSISISVSVDNDQKPIPDAVAEEAPAPEQEIETIDYVPTALPFVPRPPSPLRSMTPPSVSTPPRSTTPSTPRSLAARRAKLTHRASVLFKEQKRELEEMAQDQRDRAGYAPLVPKPPRSQQTSDASAVSAAATRPSSVLGTSSEFDAAAALAELSPIPVISEELIAALPAIPVAASDETLRTLVSAEIDLAVLESMKAAPVSTASPSEPTTIAESGDTASSIDISVTLATDAVVPVEDGVAIPAAITEAGKPPGGETEEFSAASPETLSTPQLRHRRALKQRRLSKRSSHATSAVAKGSAGSATNSPASTTTQLINATKLSPPRHKKRRQSRKSIMKHVINETVVEEASSMGVDSASPATAVVIEVGTGEMIVSAATAELLSIPASSSSHLADSASSNFLAPIPRSSNATPSPRVLLSPYDAQRAAAQAKLIAEAETIRKRAEEAAAAGLSLELFDAESASAASAIMGPKVIEMLVEEHNSDSSAASSRATTPAYLTSFTYQRGGPRTPGSSRPRHRKNHHSISSNATGDSDNSISLSIDLSDDVVLQSILNIKQ